MTPPGIEAVPLPACSALPRPTRHRMPTRALTALHFFLVSVLLRESYVYFFLIYRPVFAPTSAICLVHVIRNNSEYPKICKSLSLSTLLNY